MSRHDLGRRLDVNYERLWRRWTFILGRELLRRPLRDNVPECFVRFFFWHMLDGFLLVLLVVFLPVFVLIFVLVLIVDKGAWGDLYREIRLLRCDPTSENSPGSTQLISLSRSKALVAVANRLRLLCSCGESTSSSSGYTGSLRGVWNGLAGKRSCLKLGLCDRNIGTVTPPGESADAFDGASEL